MEVEDLKATLPNVVMSIREEKYEHLDTMWADTAKDNVFPRVSGVIWPMQLRYLDRWTPFALPSLVQPFQHSKHVYNSSS